MKGWSDMSKTQYELNAIMYPVYGAYHRLGRSNENEAQLTINLHKLTVHDATTCLDTQPRKSI